MERRRAIQIIGEGLGLAAFAGAIGVSKFLDSQPRPAIETNREIEGVARAFNIPADGRPYSLNAGMTFIIDRRTVAYDASKQEAMFTLALNKRRPIETEFPADKASIYLLRLDPRMGKQSFDDIFGEYGGKSNPRLVVEGEVVSHDQNTFQVRFRDVRQGEVYAPFYREEFFQQVHGSDEKNKLDLVQEAIFLTFGNPAIPDIFASPQI